MMSNAGSTASNATEGALPGANASASLTMSTVTPHTKPTPHAQQRRPLSALTALHCGAALAVAAAAAMVKRPLGRRPAEVGQKNGQRSPGSRLMVHGRMFSREAFRYRCRSRTEDLRLAPRRLD